MNSSDKFKVAFNLIYNELKSSPLWTDMEETVEDSPWHREANTAVHTDMVVDAYIDRAPEEWTTPDFFGAIAAAFHDVGKPKSLIWKFKEDRGDYKAFYGHEKESARMFMDLSFTNVVVKKYFDNFGPESRYIVSWMIEHHLPWDIKDPKKRDALMKTCSRYLGGVEPFINLLLGDTFGRISDDQEEKRLKALAWAQQFREDFSGKKDYFEYLNEDSAKTLSLGFLGKKPVAFFMIGTSGSGKTTFRNKVLKEFPGAGQFALDDLRHELYGEDYGFAFQKSCQDKQFKWIAKERFIDSIRNNTTGVYVHDNTSRTKRSRAMDIIELQNRGYHVVAVVFMTSLDTVLKRQHSRTDKTVPDDAVISQFFSVELPSVGEFDDIMVVNGE